MYGHRTLLRQSAVAAVTVLVAVARPATAAIDLREAERQIASRVDVVRQGEGLPPLSPDPALAAAARGFADHMARTDRYGHEADGRRPAERARAAGYDWCMVAENLAWQFRSDGFATDVLSQHFVEGWLRSPGHRRNLLSRQATQAAVAIARGAGSGRYYAVHLFGRPAALQSSFEIENRSNRTLRYTLHGRSLTLARYAVRRHTQCTPPSLRVEALGNALHPRAGQRVVIETARGGGLQVRTAETR
jgi:uncharacterized protein YkwD